MSWKLIKSLNPAPVFLLASLTFGLPAAYGGNVGVDLNIHLGNQPREVIVREPPPPPARMVIESDVDFIYPTSLGFYVAVGVPYDLFYVRNTYYLYRDGRWSYAPRSQGPWMTVRHRDLPPGLRKHKLQQIRSYRNSEYATYSRDGERYRGRHFRAGKDEWKERRHEAKERRKDEKREEKEERKHHRGGKHND